MANGGFDLDEIICDFVPTLLSVTNAYYGRSFTINDLKDYYVYIPLGIPRQQMLDFMAEHFTNETILNLPARLEGLTTVKRAKQRGDKIYIITSRNAETQTEVTRQWLEKYGIEYDDLRLTSHGCKSHAAKEFKLDYFIDDNPDNAEAVAKLNVKVFVPRYPWNEGKVKHPNIRHIDTVSEALEYI